mgnify:FL=1
MQIKYIFLVLFFVSCSLEFSDEKEIWDKGIVSNENAISINHDGLIREYVLYVPDSYDEDNPVPLVLNLHGGSGTATGQSYVSEMDQVADSAGFIIVYPQGSLVNGSSYWNSMIATEGSKGTADDVGFISILIDEISSNYNIDLNKVYACGFSNGGDMAISLACYLSDKISAVAPVSGLMSFESDSLCRPNQTTAVFVINGTADNERPYNGINDYYLSVDNTIEYWSNYHSVDSVVLENFVDGNNNVIEFYTFLSQNGLSLLKHYKIIDGDHVWFDLNVNGENLDQLIWRFFKNHDNN